MAVMKVVMKYVADLKPYENNPRNNKEAVASVKKSIQEFGFQQPIVVDKNNVIVAGHTRYLAAKELDMKAVPVVVADNLTPEQIKAYRLIDNKTAEIAGWDSNKLDEEIKDLMNVRIDCLGDFFDELKVSEEDISQISPEFEEPVDERFVLALPKSKKLGRDNIAGGTFLQWGKRKLPLTDEEVEFLDRCFRLHIKKFGVPFGFVQNLIDICEEIKEEDNSNDGMEE